MASNTSLASRAAATGQDAEEPFITFHDLEMIKTNLERQGAVAAVPPVQIGAEITEMQPSAFLETLGSYAVLALVAAPFR